MRERTGKQYRDLDLQLIKQVNKKAPRYRRRKSIKVISVTSMDKQAYALSIYGHNNAKRESLPARAGILI
jgi:hypothetical protein